MSRVAYRYTTMGWLVVSVLVLGAVAGTGAQRAFDDLAPIAVVASPAPTRGGLNDDSVRHRRAPRETLNRRSSHETPREDRSKRIDSN